MSVDVQAATYRCVRCKREGTRLFVCKQENGDALCQNATACRRRNPNQPVGS